MMAGVILDWLERHHYFKAEIAASLEAKVSVVGTWTQEPSPPETFRAPDKGALLLTVEGKLEGEGKSEKLGASVKASVTLGATAQILPSPALKEWKFEGKAGGKLPLFPPHGFYLFQFTYKLPRGGSASVVTYAPGASYMTPGSTFTNWIEPPSAVPAGTGNVYCDGHNSNVLAGVEADLYDDIDPVTAKGPNGEVLLVWTKQLDPSSGSSGLAIMAAWFDGESWQNPAQVPGSGGNGHSPTIVFDAAGIPMVVWSASDMPGLPANPTTEQIFLAAIDTDLFFSRFVSGSWTPATRLFAQSGADDVPALGLGAGGTVILTWTHADLTASDPQGANTQLRSSRWDGSGWSAPECVSTGRIVGQASVGEINNQTVVFWPQKTNTTTLQCIYSSAYDGAWSAPEIFTPQALPQPQNGAKQSVAFTGLKDSNSLPEIPKDCCKCDKYKKLRRGSGDCVVSTDIDEETCTEYTTYKPCTSLDPNDILGPIGFGTGQWVSGDDTFRYTVRFENDPVKAQLPAQTVRVTQRLDPNLDLATFRLEHIGFGETLLTVPAGRVFYQARINVTNTLGVLVDITAGLDLATREISWEFTSIDPETGDLPWDPFAGFLPPNTNGIIGQGFVTYTIKPKPAIASGDIVNAQARIFFDYNEPMDTPHIFNTVDTSLPTSTMLPLPLTTNRNVFPVQWAGSDAYGGAGVGSFDIYVSDNSGPWKLWLQNTPNWQQLFVGECGHTYAFYSVARDNVGHLEAAVPAVQAQIYVLPNSAPSLAEIADRVIAVGQALTITNRATDLDAGQQLTFSLAPDAPAGMTVDPFSGVLRWRPPCVQGGSSNWITVLATDNGCGNLSSAQSFAVVVTECLQTSLGGVAATAGGSGCIPVSLESGFDLTNLTFTVNVPEGRFTNFTITATAPEVGSATIVPVGQTQAVVTLAAQPGQALRGPKQFAEVCFALVPDQASAFVRMGVEDIFALRDNGTPFGNTSGSPGRTVVVSEHPLLDGVLGADGKPALVLYARPGWNCAIEECPTLAADCAWREIQRVTTTNLVTALPLPGTHSQGYYRAVRFLQSRPKSLSQPVEGPIYRFKLDGDTTPR